MSINDPFAGDAERTVIRPSPAGRRAPSAAPSPPAAPDVALPEDVFTRTGLNPLAAAAAPLLALAARFRTTPSYADIDGLRQRIVREIHEFERRVGATDLPREALRGGHYALCATIDDVIANTPWGGGGQWARYSMASQFHKDVAGGDRFFEFLAHFRKDPARYGDVLELMYLCLSLGFEGRLRVVERGASEWTRIREALFGSIRERRGPADRDLSPRWRGLEAPHRPLSAVLPAWVVGAAALAVLAIVYVAFAFDINARSDPVFARFNGLPPTGQAQLRVDAPAAAPVDTGVRDRLTAFLAPEIRQGLVGVDQAGRSTVIRISGADMFPSGSATLAERFTGVVRRVAAALDPERGAVEVLGYTDNVPIRTVRFPSNFQLSEARADTVRGVVKAALKTARPIAVEGRADADPVASNDTPEGRARNRRIEIVLNAQEGAS